MKETTFSKLYHRLLNDKITIDEKRLLASMLYNLATNDECVNPLTITSKNMYLKMYQKEDFKKFS